VQISIIEEPQPLLEPERTHVIDALPLLDTAVGLFGSLVADGGTSRSVFEIAVTVALIVHN